MSTVGDTLASRVRISNPNPAYCPSCYRGAEDGLRFVDFDAAFDGGEVTTERDGIITSRYSADDLHLCEDCVKAAVEALSIKPELYQRVARELKRVERERDHWKDYAKRVEAVLEDRPERRGR